MKWLADNTLQNVVGAILSSAAVTGLAGTALRRLTNMPTDWLVVVALFVAFFGFVGLLPLMRRWNPTNPMNRSAEEPAATTPVLPRVVFQFFGDERFPEPIQKQNIDFWFTWFPLDSVWRYHVHGVESVGPTSDNKTQLTMRVKLAWIVFLAFERATSFGHVRVTSSGKPLPAYEIKWRSAKYLVVAFSDDVPVGTLEIATSL